MGSKEYVKDGSENYTRTGPELVEVVVLGTETEMQVESSLLGSGTDAAGKEEGEEGTCFTHIH